MRGRIVSRTEYRLELCDLRGSTRIFWSKGGFWLGENGRLYVLNRFNRSGRQQRYEEVELLSIGRSSGFHKERVAGDPNPRPVKDRMAEDHVRLLYKKKGQTLADIAERYDASRSYILKLLREYDIAGRPPGRRPIQEGLEPGGHIPK